ncbi:MAG TPA: hypothetical protein VNB49_18065 [Candidatus Dormibacteraeota bacterium]|nr:hypothetical protein [Candidatus Dormibacteraeota bacterium]
MLPSELTAEHFDGYPPEARKLAKVNVIAFRRLPLTFLPNLLREVIEYDFKFPSERRAIEKELENLNSLSAEQIKDWFGGFAQIHLSSQLEAMDWVNDPAQFVEQLSAYLWSSRQLDAFRSAALIYGDRLLKAVPPDPPAAPRLGITVIGQGIDQHEQPLFRKLRAHGTYFTRIKPENGLETLLKALAARAKERPSPYAHWYVDGGQSAASLPSVTCISYGTLNLAREALLARMRTEIEKPGMGPEKLRSLLARMRPQDLGFSEQGDLVTNRFELKILTEGSGTQIFSTTFAQWAAREVLRRAQPLTLLVRFAPRQRQKTMNELLSASPAHVELDPLGSLVDADMGAYYNWLNQERLTGAKESSFLAWFENHSQAVAIGPSVARATVSTESATLADLLAWMS